MRSLPSKNPRSVTIASFLVVRRSRKIYHTLLQGLVLHSVVSPPSRRRVSFKSQRLLTSPRHSFASRRIPVRLRLVEVSTKQERIPCQARYLLDISFCLSAPDQAWDPLPRTIEICDGFNSISVSLIRPRTPLPRPPLKCAV